MKPYWNPYAAGIALGLVALASFVLTGKGRKTQAVDLLKLADYAMYRAKRISRNCCVVGE
jgi:GGDEF domain-containing protein